MSFYFLICPGPSRAISSAFPTIICLTHALFLLGPWPPLFRSCPCALLCAFSHAICFPSLSFPAGCRPLTAHTLYVPTCSRPPAAFFLSIIPARAIAPLAAPCPYSFLRPFRPPFTFPLCHPSQGCRPLSRSPPLQFSPSLLPAICFPPLSFRAQRGIS